MSHDFLTYKMVKKLVMATLERMDDDSLPFIHEIA